MDMKNFLCPLHRLSPTASANSAAKAAASDTLTEAGYAHFGNENHPIVLSWISFSVLFQLHGGSSRACT